MEFPSEKSAVFSRLFLESAVSENKLSYVPDISDNLDEHSLGVITVFVNNALKENDLETAETYLLIGERVGQYAGDEYMQFSLMARRAVELLEHNIDLQEALLKESTNRLESLVPNENPDVIRDYNYAGLNLVNVYLEKEQHQAARDQLYGMAKIFHENKEVALEMGCVFNLLQTSYSLGDLEAAENDCLRLIKFPKKNFLAAQSSLDLHVSKLITQLVLGLYDKGDEKYPVVVSICEFMRRVDPDNLQIVYVLGEVKYLLHEWERCIELFNIIVQRQSELPTHLRASKALHYMAFCYTQLNEDELALEKIRIALDIEPESPFLLFAYGQMLTNSGYSQDAISAYTQAMEACLIALQAQPDRDSLKDLYGMIILDRAKSYKATGNMKQAIADLELLKTIDDISRAVALVTMSNWYQEENKIPEALQCLEEAEEYHESESVYDIRLKQVDLWIRLKDYAKAIELLKGLAYKGARSEESIEQLDLVPADSPLFQTALKWKGYAKTEAGWPSRGMVDLDAAIAANPGDAEAYFLRAMTRITYGIKVPDEDNWNKQLSPRSLLHALNDLYSALRIAPDYVTAKERLRWLIDRAGTYPAFYELFVQGGNPDRCLFNIFPKLEDAFRSMHEAFDYNLRRDWKNAIPVWQKTMNIFQDAGFPLLAESIHVRLADTYLRLLDMDKVEMHLEKAMQRQELVNVPLSEDVMLKFEERFQKKESEYRPPVAGIELDYVWIYDLFSYDLTIITYLKANFRHRLGDIDGALKCLDFFEPYLSNLDQYFEYEITTQMLLGFAGIYRDAKKYQKALKIMDFLESKTKPDFQVFYTKALIYSMSGNSKKALSYYKKSFTAMNESEKSLYPELNAQFAAELLSAGKPQEALSTIETLNKIYDTLPDRSKLVYNTVAAYAYAGSGKPTEGIRCFENGMAILEEKRTLISDFEGKIGWFGSQDSLINIGIKLYIETKNHKQAFEIAESTKGRVLLEQLAGSSSSMALDSIFIGELDTIKKSIQIATQIVKLDKKKKKSDEKAELFAKLKELLGAYDSLKSISLNKDNVTALKSELENIEKLVLEKETTLQEANIFSDISKHGFDDFKVLLD